MLDPDLHAMANIIGFGKAKADLKAAGHWNHDIDANGQPAPEWRVEVEATATVRIVMTVRAPDAETAKRLAREDAPEEHDEDWTADAGTICVRSATVVLELDPEDPPAAA